MGAKAENEWQRIRRLGRRYASAMPSPSRRRKPSAAEALLDAYREGVAELVESLRECQLTLSHVAHVGGAAADAQVDALHAVQRELTKRLARFERVEPGRWEHYYQALAPAYAARDAENRIFEERVRRGELP